jgi:hypothetical protein
MEKLIAKKTEVGKKDITGVYAKADEALKAVKAGFDASKIVNRCYSLARTKGKVRGSEQQKEINDMFSKIDSAFQNNFLTTRAKESLYNAKSILNNVNCDYEERLSSLLSRLKTVRDSPEPFADSILDFELDILSELAITSIKLHKLGEAEKYIAMYGKKGLELYGLNDSYKLVPAYIRLLIKIKNNDADEIEILTKQLEEGLLQFKDKMDISFELEANYQLIAAYMFCRDYNRALKKANMLLSHPLLYVRSDLECFARILNLIIHFELNNIQLLEYLIVSTYRYLYKREKIFLIESYILTFLKKLGSINNNTELLELLEIQKLSLQKLLTDKYEKNAFEYFDFISWTDDKIGTLKS